VTSNPSPERRAAIDAARSKWIEQLTDLSRRNNLRKYRFPRCSLVRTLDRYQQKALK